MHRRWCGAAMGCITVALYVAGAAAAPGIQARVMLSESATFEQGLATDDYRGESRSLFAYLLVDGEGLDRLGGYQIPYRITDYGGNLELGPFQPFDPPERAHEGSLVLGRWRLSARQGLPLDITVTLPPPGNRASVLDAASGDPLSLVNTVGAEANTTTRRCLQYVRPVWSAVEAETTPATLADWVSARSATILPVAFPIAKGHELLFIDSDSRPDQPISAPDGYQFARTIGLNTQRAIVERGGTGHSKRVARLDIASGMVTEIGAFVRYEASPDCSVLAGTFGASLTIISESTRTTIDPDFVIERLHLTPAGVRVIGWPTSSHDGTRGHLANGAISVRDYSQDGDLLGNVPLGIRGNVGADIQDVGMTIVLIDGIDGDQHLASIDDAGRSVVRRLDSARHFTLVGLVRGDIVLREDEWGPLMRHDRHTLGEKERLVIGWERTDDRTDHARVDQLIDGIDGGFVALTFTLGHQGQRLFSIGADGEIRAEFVGLEQSSSSWWWHIRRNQDLLQVWQPSANLLLFPLMER